MAGGMTEYTLTACDWTTRLAEIDTYESATIIARHNAVSTYELTLPSDTDAARALVRANRPRLLVSADGVVLRSGPVTRLQRDLAEDGSDMLTLNGVDDLAWLRARLAHPQPGSAAPPYSTTAYDSRTGPASQVLAGYVDRNAGPGAVPNRQVPGLVVPTPAAYGGTVTTAARYQNLLDFLVPIATAARIGIRIRDLTFETYQPSGGAVFSVELGTLAAWTSVAEAPDLTYLYLAGQGEGTLRTIREYQDTTALLGWGRIEGFQDRRDTNVAAELDQAAAETLAQAAKPIAVAMQALDTDGQTFLRDWNVGDLATARIGDATISDVIVEAAISLEPNAPPRVAPVLGETTVNLNAWRALGTQSRRLRQLERT
jgi:hypothetical protein